MSFIEKAKKKLGELTGSNDGNVSSASDVAGQSTVDKVKSEQGIFDKIQNFFTGGYGTKEDLRELDRKLRDDYSAVFKRMRHRWEEISLSALKAKKAMMITKKSFKSWIELKLKLTEQTMAMLDLWIGKAA